MNIGGLRALAYRIKKNRKGHYIMFNMETGPEALKVNMSASWA